jgi:hypothetical protein
VLTVACFVWRIQFFGSADLFNREDGKHDDHEFD